MRVLFITIERPWPPGAGADLRNWQHVSAAAAAWGGEAVGVLYLTARDGSDGAPPPPPSLALWRRLDARAPSVVWRPPDPATPLDLWLTEESRATVAEILAETRPAVVVLSHTHLHALAPLVRQAGAALVVDMHNVESDLYRRLVPWRMPLKAVGRRWFEGGPRRIAAVERQLMQDARQVWLCSEEDRRRLLRLGRPRAELRVMPNGLPPERFRAEAPREAPPSRVEGRAPELLFLGQLGYPPNQQAARFLARRLAPRLADAAPAAAIVVAGRDPSRKLAERIAARPNMRLLVDPPEVAPLLARADLMLVPLFQGGGTRLKVLEALAAGLPLVATPLAVEGLDLVPEREVLLGRGARDLVRQCLRLLEDQGLYRRLSAAGLAAYAARFAPEVLGPKVAAALEAAVQR